MNYFDLLGSYAFILFNSFIIILLSSSTIFCLVPRWPAFTDMYPKWLQQNGRILSLQQKHTKAVCTKWWDIMWDPYKMVLISTLEITKPTNQIFTKWSDSITATKAVCTKWWDIMWDMWESYKMVLISTLEITNPTIQIFTKWSDSLTATKKVCTKWWDSYKMVLVPFLEVAKRPKSDLYKMDP